MDFEKEEREHSSSADWKKEGGEEKKDFDFDAFLADDLEDRITAALDGKDLLARDAFGDSVSEYVPRRSGDGEHGKHEAPEPVNTAQQPPETDGETPAEPRIDPNDPRYAAPERPHVVVAEPRPKVYVSPPSGDGYGSQPEPPENNSGRGLKRAIVVLAVIAVLIGLLLAFLSRGSNGGENAAGTPKPTSPASERQEAEVSTPAPTDAPAEAAPTPTPAPQAATYRITVTAGSGGSVSPNGAVTVNEGDAATFTITPNAGYELSQLLVDGSAVDLTDSYRFANVTADHTIYAVFQQAATPTPEPTATPSSTPEPTAEPTPTPTAPPAGVVDDPLAEPAGGDAVDGE